MKRTLLARITTLAASAILVATCSIAFTRGSAENASSLKKRTGASYKWVRATDNYGWGNGKVYVLNLVSFNDRLWAFEDEAVHYSTDGKNWTLATRHAGWPGSTFSGNTLVFDNKMWVLGGFVDKRLRNDIWYSVDGRGWTRATERAPWQARRGHPSVAFDGRIWIMGGNNQQGNKNDVWYSPDGIQWTKATEHAKWSERSDHQALVFKGKIWILGGRDHTGENLYNDVWYSDDGVNWTQAASNAEWGKRLRPAAVVFDDKMWVLGGSGKNDAWYTDDGIHWKQATANTGWFPRSGLSSAVLNNRLWIMGGKTGVSSNSNPQDVWYMAPAPRHSRRSASRSESWLE
ncbi:MAG: exo-alpha-sialidase [Blastocatellia bacterium]|nr:exo-alpha-sialidase [Blastocatellia bacterium]